MQALMDIDQDSLDEAAIAAYLAGTLSPEERDVVERKLTRDADARELLCMAQEAMDAAMDVPDASEHQSPASTSSPADGDRPATRRPNRLARFGWYAGIAVVVFALGLSLRLVLGPPEEALRSDTPSATFTVEVATPDLHVRWAAVPDAYVYQVTVWNPTAARVVAEHETTETHILPSSPFMQTLRDQLDRSQEYTLRVDALNAEKRYLSHSSTHFQLSP
jgi:anti-sigma-K factor RskA